MSIYIIFMLVMFLTLNLGSFLLMGWDKLKAGKGRRRVPEKTFHLLALSGGTLGVLIGSGVFHHKISKPSFLGVIAFISLVQFFVVMGLYL